MLAYRVLGPVEIVGRERLVMGRSKFAAFTAALVLHHDLRVSLDRLSESLWVEPPASAMANLRTYAHRLRKLVGRDMLQEVAGGYRLEATAAQCDHAEFRRLAGLGRAAARDGDDIRALECYHQALGLWRHDQAAAGAGRLGPLGGWLTALDEERLLTMEDRAESWLRLGHTQLALDELRDIVAVTPVRTRAWSLRMLVHHRLGERQAVLETYELARRTFRAELGVDVDAELIALRHRLLRRSPPPRVAPVAQPTPDRRHPSLPAVVPPVGRSAVLQLIAAGLAVDAPGHRPRIVVVHGPSGAGKSVVALQAGHLAADRFPGGQLYLDLRRLVPAEPAAVVDAALRLLGVRPPPRAPEAELLLLSRLADWRLLVVVDHVTNVTQVAPLSALPPQCALIVTADRPLGALEASVRASIGPLGVSASVAMLRSLVGPGRGSDADLAGLAAACHGLPASLRLAAAWLIDRPELRVRSFVEDLTGRCLTLSARRARDGSAAVPGDAA